jgi:hypothetical protein
VFHYVVSNWGEGAAQDGSLAFDAGQPTLRVALRPGEETNINLVVPFSEIPDDVDSEAPSTPACELRTSRMPSATGGSRLPRDPSVG